MGQFLRALFPTAPAELPSRAQILLNERELQLFNRMMPFDRGHSIEVFRRVAEMSPNNRVVQTAALLHDVGKGKPRLSHRVGLALG
ncbi:MAG: HD domain-containing protein [Chloroflexi bacterium]|nr:HD domain-containing protein [Chloroflexota bacterium]